MHAANSDLGRCDKRQVTPFDGIDLRRIATRNEPDPLQYLVAGEIRRYDGRESLLANDVHCILDECQLEQHGLVFEKVKARACNCPTAFHVDQAQPLAKFEMIERFEVEPAWAAPAATFSVSVLAGRYRRVGVRHIRNAQL